MLDSQKLAFLRTVVMSSVLRRRTSSAKIVQTIAAGPAKGLIECCLRSKALSDSVEDPLYQIEGRRSGLHPLNHVLDARAVIVLDEGCRVEKGRELLTVHLRKSQLRNQLTWANT